jgi:hypothetical protein
MRQAKEALMTTRIVGKISDSLLEEVRAAGGSDENHTIALAISRRLGPAKSVFDRDSMTVTIEMDDDQFVAHAIRKGLADR